MGNLKYRSQQHQNNDEVFRYNERYEERVRTTDRAAPAPRERVSQERENIRTGQGQIDC